MSTQRLIHRAPSLRRRRLHILRALTLSALLASKAVAAAFPGIRPWTRAATLALALGLSACQSIQATNETRAAWRAEPLIEVSESVRVSPETAVIAGALALSPPISVLGGAIVTAPQGALLYLIYDPLAPNWTIQERQLTEDTYTLSMRAKSFRTGGDGETGQILKRRAQQLQREKGYAAYKILDYSEGVESSTPFTHRVSEGTFQLVKAPAAPGR